MNPAVQTVIALPPVASPPAVHTLAAPADPPGAESPHFLVGQDHLGRWVAVETHGLGGGLFRSYRDALHYAADQTRGQAQSVDVTAERVELRI